jgi:hypothetical protein
MVSGRKSLEFWYYARLATASLPANFLPALFPGDPTMQVINEILAKCIVEHEKDCLKSADELLGLVDQAIAFLRSPGLRPSAGAPWLCQVCCKGHYMPQGPPIQVEQPSAARAKFRVHVCDNVDCHRVELFWKDPARS